MQPIAVLVPTYKRSQKLEKFVKDFHKVSLPTSKLYFVVDSEDLDSVGKINSLGETYFVAEGEYVAAINFGFDHTSEPFFLMGSDDIVFNDGWDKRFLQLAKENPDKHVFGGVDEWDISQTMKHISHPFVRRSYVKPPFLFPGYIHYMCDIEFVQRAFRDDVVMIVPEFLIEHPHTIADGTDPTKWDETYQRSFTKIDLDKDLYDRRKGEFEMWDFGELQWKRVIPTKLNPLYNKTKVSIVIPTYNDADFLKGCLESISQQTFYRYEIIIIDNGSDPIQKTANPWDKIDTKAFLDSIVLGDKSCELKIIRLPKNLWVNPAWNMGAEEATGDYVCIINADILLSRDWDKYMVSALNTPHKHYMISCPYETNPNRDKPYALDKWFMSHVPHMIKGPCFMFRKSDVPKMFPIPPELKHWCGDNWLADRALDHGGVVFAKKSQIYHFITQSGNRVKFSKIATQTYKDVLAYEKIVKRDMSWLKNTFPEAIRNVVDLGQDSVGDHECKTQS
jgi:glycosyltransferase involved in cell wall biosynthesis